MTMWAIAGRLVILASIENGSEETRKRTGCGMVGCDANGLLTCIIARIPLPSDGSSRLWKPAVQQLRPRTYDRLCLIDIGGVFIPRTTVDVKVEKLAQYRELLASVKGMTAFDRFMLIYRLSDARCDLALALASQDAIGVNRRSQSKTATPLSL